MIIDEVIKKYPNMPKPDAVFNIQNVADYVYLDSNTYEGHIQDCFSYRIPFNKVWFDFKENTTLRIEKTERLISKEDCTSVGTLISIVEDSFRMGVFIKNIVFGLEYVGELALPLDEKFKAKAIKKDMEAYPVWATDFYTNIFKQMKLMQSDFPVDITFGSFPVITTALNFLHCKNVSVQDHLISQKLIKANIKRGKPRPYFEKFYTLGIESIKKILNTEGQAQTIGLKKAFHICRGHFKTYDTNPLFGKVRGTFWVSAHTKGNIKSGVIKKDYKLKY